MSRNSCQPTHGRTCGPILRYPGKIVLVGLVILIVIVILMDAKNSYLSHSIVIVATSHGDMIPERVPVGIRSILYAHTTEYCP